MTVRPITALIGVVVLSVLVGGCGPTDQPARPVVESVTTAPASGPTGDPTGDPTVATTAAAKPKAKPTSKPAPKPTTHKPSPKPSPKPSSPKPTPKPTTKPPSGQQGVHPGAFCSPEGAIGYTSKGTKMRCTRKAGEDRARWRAA